MNRATQIPRAQPTPKALARGFACIDRPNWNRPTSGAGWCPPGPDTTWAEATTEGLGWAAHRLLSVWIEAKYLPMLRAAKRFRGQYGELSACVPACATCPVWMVCPDRKVP